MSVGWEWNFRAKEILLIFPFVNFPFIYRNIPPPSHAYEVYISQFLHYLRVRVSLLIRIHG
jgi:hypothetical protein